MNSICMQITCAVATNTSNAEEQLAPIDHLCTIVTNTSNAEEQLVSIDHMCIVATNTSNAEEPIDHLVVVPRYDGVVCLSNFFYL